MNRTDSNCPPRRNGVNYVKDDRERKQLIKEQRIKGMLNDHCARWISSVGAWRALEVQQTSGRGVSKCGNFQPNNAHTLSHETMENDTHASARTQDVRGLVPSASNQSYNRVIHTAHPWPIHTHHTPSHSSHSVCVRLKPTLERHTPHFAQRTSISTAGPGAPLRPT